MGALSAAGDLSSLLATYYPSNLEFFPSCIDGIAPSYPVPTPGGLLAGVVSSGTLRLGRQFPNPPIAYVNSTTNADTGLEYDLGNKIAARFSTAYGKSFTVQWTNGSLQTLTAGLQTADDIDAVLGGATITMSRTWLIPSCSYANSRMAWILKNTSSIFSTIASELNLNAVGLTYAVSAGTTADIWAQSNLPLATRTGASTTTELYELLRNNTVKAVVRFEPFNSAWLDTQPDRSAYKTGTFGPYSFLAVVTRKDNCTGSSTRNIFRGNQELIDATDRILNNLRNTPTPNAILAANNATSPPHVPTCGTPVSNITTWPIPTAGGTLQSVLNSGVLRIGRQFPNAPFSYLTGSSTLSGVDVDFVNEIARQLGVAYNKTIYVQWINSTLASLFANPAADTFDIIVAGVGASYPRTIGYTFSCSYTSVRPSYIVGPKNTTLRDSINDVLGLNRSGIIIAVLAGSSALSFAQTNLALATIFPVATSTELYATLSNQSVHAILRQDPNNQFWIFSTGAANGTYNSGNYGSTLAISIGARRDACSYPAGTPTITDTSISVTSSVAASLMFASLGAMVALMF